MRIARPAGTAAAVACVALLGTGCGDKNLNTSKLENEIKTRLERQVGLRISSVDCPGDVKVKKGDTFNCKLKTSAGQSATVRVTQTDDKGHVTYRVGA